MRTIEIGTVVLVGAVAAVVLTGRAADLPARTSGSACLVSQLAAEQAALAWYAGPGQSTHWPASFGQLTSGEHPVLALPSGVTVRSEHELSGRDWTLRLAGGDTSTPTFTCT